MRFMLGGGTGGVTLSGRSDGERDRKPVSKRVADGFRGAILDMS